MDETQIGTESHRAAHQRGSRQSCAGSLLRRRGVNVLPRPRMAGLAGAIRRQAQHNSSLFYNALDADYRPVEAMERMYFELIVSAKWRLRRLQKFEAALYASLYGTSEKARSGFCLCKRGRSPFCGPEW